MKRRALLVGINRYQYEGTLWGPVNDVDGIRQFLVEVARYAARDICILVDAKATCEAIKEKLGWLCDGLTEGDSGLFHFSGHGGPVGGNNKTYDTLIPYDFDGDVDTALIADDFRTAFGGLADGVVMTWIADACFSGPLMTGDGQRLDAAALDALYDYVRPRALVPSKAASELFAANAERVPLVDSTGTDASPLKVAMISASDDDAWTNPKGEATFEGTPFGALSYYLLAVLRDPKSRALPLRALFTKVSDALQRAIPTQVPALHGDRALWEKPFLGGTSARAFGAVRFDVGGEPLDLSSLNYSASAALGLT